MAQIRDLNRPIGTRRPLVTTAATVAAAVCALGFAPVAQASPVAAGGRVPITSDSELVPAGATDEGAASPAGALSVRVYLNGRNPAGLRQLARQVSTPGNPHYRHFLTPAQYTASYGPTARQTAAVVSWLRASGLTVTSTDSHYVAASGDQASVERAVGARMHLFRLNGTSLRAPAGRLSVPQTVAGDVLSISGLSTPTSAVRPASARPVPVTAAASATCSSSFGANPATTLPTAYGAVQPWQSCGYLPSQLRSGYGVTPTGLTGAGTRVAVVGAYASATIAADAATYASLHGEQAWADGQLTQVVPDGLPAQPSSWGMEEALDVEAVHAMAPGADVVYVAAPDTEDDSFVDAVSRIVDGHLADIVSNSWVLGADTGVPSAITKAFEQDFMQGAVEGIGFLFASGDTGSQAASADGTGPLQTATEYPASDPWVTAVGGTTLAVGADGQYGWETGWETDYAQLSADGTTWVDAPGTFSNGSGGGPSSLFTRPPYQRSAIPTTPSSSSGGAARRMVPDVAMDADPVTGMLVGQTFTVPGGSVFAQYASGGSSLAAPLFAGIQALAQQRAGSPLGFANPVIYQAAAAGAFRDVTGTPSAAPTPPAAVHTVTSISPTGTISTSNVLATFGRAQDAGLSVTTGYDDVTGLGTPTESYFNQVH
ncbi:protease pro-enzyme activation domain-containing protein [Peterkaempfera sp. SMS 1(5)a]|uniref:S53 family peptidase n=1 Tax=Peterkaempfera podocarpi TaxID=3232308 RepID=UPI00366CF984